MSASFEIKKRHGEQPSAHQRAEILVEAIPWIRRFSGSIVVVKHGGNAMGDEESLASFAKDIVLMASVGLRPVVVHGGGPQIGQLLSRLGIESRFVEGRRVTDAETLEVARMVLVGKVNRDVVGAINVLAPIAVGLSGEDARLLVAKRRAPELGFVGDIEVVDPSIIERLLAQGIVPVVASIAVDPGGQAYNVNADSVAGAIATALKAEKLIFLTDVEGIRKVPDDPSTLLRQTTADELAGLLAEGAFKGGMVPKAEACIHGLRNGVGVAHVLDGREPHALLVEIFTDSGLGTMVRP